MVDIRKRRLTLDIFDTQRLEKAVDKTTYLYGEEIFETGQVVIDKINPFNAFCTVHDQHPYPVEIKVSGDYLYLKCECRFGDRGNICKHEIAAFLAIREALRQRAPSPWRSQFRELIAKSRDHGQHHAKPAPCILVFSLQGVSHKSIFSPWKIHPVKIPLKDLSKSLRERILSLEGSELDDLLTGEPEIRNKTRAYFQKMEPSGCINCGQDAVLLANVLIEQERHHRFSNQNVNLGDQLGLIAEKQYPIYRGNWDNPLVENLHIVKEPASISIALEMEIEQLTLRALIHVENTQIPIQTKKPDGYNNEIQLVSIDPLWLLRKNLLFNIDEPAFASTLLYFLETAEIIIPKKSIELFRNKYLLDLAENFQITGDLISHEFVDLEPIPRLYLSEHEGEIIADLRFVYGDHVVGYCLPGKEEAILQESDTWHLIHILRDAEQEKLLHKKACTQKYGLKQTPRSKYPGRLSLRAQVDPVDFLLKDVPKLLQDGFEVYGEESLTIARVNRNTPTISLSIVSGIDWFDIKAIINFGEIEVDFKELRRLLKTDTRYIKLADGTIGEIPKDWLERYRLLFGLGEMSGEKLRMGRYHLTLIDQLVREENEVELDQQFIFERETLGDFRGVKKVDIPSNFLGELRPYQKAGFDWLHFLHLYRFGGCLADDMGLGKTIQTLAFLQSLKEGEEIKLEYQTGKREARRAALLVVPRSLLVNWQREAARFTPQLRLCEYFDGNRETKIEEFDRADIVITTYGILRRDIRFLETYRFQCVILDESQAIKNPLSKTARAVRKIKSDHRFSLTGTPIENTTLELWSLFAFLNPGLLGNLEHFKREFVFPIERDGNRQKAELLRKMIYPFILRRTKNQVAPELPPRNERTLYVDMHPAQQRFYNRTRNYYRGILLGMVENGDISTNRLKILEGLLRLRQISNHPRLVDKSFRGESGKFDLLMETLETLSIEGHKALVFSQFVKMLAIVQDGLRERGIEYEYLDGHTKDRQARVDRFQSDPHIKLFLISLRAGGLGLNLTAADYVIHIDPWWNPAVELQASDRTHRIGQEKPVFVFKLITRDSVEEKVLLLQERKQDIVDQVITTDTSFLKSITADDLSVLFGD